MTEECQLLWVATKQVYVFLDPGSSQTPASNWPFCRYNSPFQGQSLVVQTAVGLNEIVI